MIAPRFTRKHRAGSPSRTQRMLLRTCKTLYISYQSLVAVRKTKILPLLKPGWPLCAPTGNRRLPEAGPMTMGVLP